MSTMNSTACNITINYAKKALEISKKFRVAASVYGSASYNELKEAKSDFPTFRVCVKNSSKRKIEDKITMEDMATYIIAHSGADSEQMATFEELRGVSIKDSASIFESVESANFQKIKQWFFLTYPELATKSEKRRSRIDEILANAAKNSAKVEAA